MKGGHQHLISQLTRPRGKDGFTIVEVMIVLAVSGALFASVVIMLSGRQAQAQFNQAINDVKTQIEQIANEVESGYFGDPATATCTWGDRSNCMYIGKLIRFNSTSEQYAAYTLIGRRTATSFATSQPYAVAVADTKNLLFGLQVVSINGNTPAANGVTLLSQFSTDASGTTSGSRAVMVAPFPGNLSTALTPAPAIPTTLTINPANGVRICFRSGTTNQSGLITVGAQGASRAVELSIRGNVNCS